MKTRFATLIAALTVAAAAQGDMPSPLTTETFPDGHIEVAVAAQGDTPSRQVQISTRFITAQHVAVAAQGDTPSPTQDIAIKNIDAATAFQSLRASFPDASGVVTAIKLDSNSLTVIADHPKAAELRKRLAEMDVSPKQIMIEAVITNVDADGSEYVTRGVRTSFCFVDGIPVEIPWGKHLKLKITPTSVPYKAAELRKRLAEMDVSPKQIMIEAVLTEVDADGGEKVIARPCVCLVDGIPGEIVLGENGKTHLKLKITATSVPEVDRK